MTDPRECPFCNSTEINLDALGNDHPFYVMTCTECQADGPIKPTAAEAIEAWNRRPQPDGNGQ